MVIMQEKYNVEITTSTILKTFLILGLIALAIMLKDVIVLVLLSFILATALGPVVDRIQKKGIPRTLAILSVYVVAGLAVYLLFRAIVPTIVDQINLLSSNRQFYIEQINSIFARTPQEFQDSTREILNELPGKIKDISLSGFLSSALGIFSGFFGFLAVLVLTFYFLVDKDGIEKTFVFYMPDDYKKRGLRVFGKIARNMSLWFRGQLLLSFIIGLITYIGLLIIGVDFALTLAVIAAFTEIIPVLGPVLGGIPAFLVALADEPIKGLYVLIFYMVVQIIEGHFLVPQIMKKSLGLSPAFIIISILIGARLFGILGIILAIPVASALSVIIEEIHEYDRIEEEERKNEEERRKRK